MNLFRKKILFLPLLWSFFAIICLVPQKIFHHSTDHIPQKPLVALIASYKNQAWYKGNLDSVFMQEYQNYRVIYIADDQETGQLVQEYIAQLGLQQRVTLIINQTRRGKMANIYDAIHTCDDKEIIIDLDGDDKLKDPEVFAYINKIYQKKVVLTYGQFETYPAGNIGFCKQIPDWVIKQNKFRSYEWVTSHLRTFYAGLFKSVPKEEFMCDGSFLQTSSDQAFILSMLEKAGEYSCFTNRVSYIYNQANQLNDFRVDPYEQFRIAKLIRSRTPYKPLSEQEIDYFCS